MAGACAIAAGNTLAPVTAAHLLRRVGFRTQLDRVRDALAIIFLAALGAMLVSATIGTAALDLSGDIGRGDRFETWAVWWTGDAMGVLLVAPFLWSVTRLRGRELRGAPLAELVVVLVALAAACVLAVGSDRPLLFLALPPLGWIAWRFQQPAAAPAGLLVSATITWATVHDNGPLATESVLDRMLMLQAYNAAIAFTTLFFAAAVAAQTGVYRREHRVAETLQRSLLPEQLPDIPGVSVAARYIPASGDVGVGGDWYDVVRLGDGRVGLVIGDVAGHGVSAAATMGQIHIALQAYALEAIPPAPALARLARVVRALQPNAMATVLYAQVDLATGIVRYASAGHLPPIVVRGADARFVTGGRSVPIGATDGAQFEEAELQLGAGDTLVLYTDGLVERRGEPIDDRLRLLRREVAAAPADLGARCDAVVAALLGEGQGDDVALLAVRLDRAEPLRLRTFSRLDSVPVARRAVERWLCDNHVDEPHRFELLVASTEAYANAVRHAYDGGEGPVELDGTIDGANVVITVTDRGRWRPAAAAHDGCGLVIMRALMDDVAVDTGTGGTTVTMTRRVSAAGA